jgi:hypothetical protein
MPQQPSLFSRSLRMFAGRSPLYLLATALPYALLLAAAYGVLHVAHWPVDPSNVPDSPTALWSSFTFSGKIEVLGALSIAMWFPFYMAGRGVCRIASSQHTGQAISLGAVLADMALFAVPALAFSLLIGFLLVFGAAILLIPCALVAPAFSLVVPASVVESVGLFAAIGRNFSLLGRTFGRTLAAFSLYALVFVVVAVIKVVVQGLLPLGQYTLFSLWFATMLVPIALYNICLTLLCHEAQEKSVREIAAPAIFAQGSTQENR